MLPSELLEQGWCQGVTAKDEEGYNIGGQNELAVSWCFVGAAIRSFGLSNQSLEFIHSGEQILFGGELSLVAAWNDNPERTQAEVVAVARLVEIKMGLRVEGEDWEEEEPLEVGEIEMVERELVGIGSK